jgi:hypothetical protein
MKFDHQGKFTRLNVLDKYQSKAGKAGNPTDGARRFSPGF